MNMFTPSVTESQAQTALRTFLLSILPAGIEVVRGQDNLVAEPAGPDFVVMTPMLRTRLATNVDDYADALFTGSIAGPTLTITAVSLGALSVGNVLLGVGLAANTTVTALGTGAGGIGTYVVTPAQTLASQAIAAGVKTALQGTQMSVQIDIHGPNAADNSQIISTLLRDEYAEISFAASGFDVSPLYAGEPKQMPFLNAEQQIETRWIMDAVLQINPAVTVPQQFASVLNAEVINVDAAYPP